MIMDKPMPHSPDAERAVLGAVLTNNNAFYRVVGKIDVRDFYKDGHRDIFATMRRMAEKGISIEPLTLKEELAKHGQLEKVGGVAYVSSLLDVVPDVANVERYADIVKEKSTLRRLIILGDQVMRSALDAPSEPAEVLAEAERELYAIGEGATEKSFVSIDRIVRTNMGAIEAAANTGGRLVTGVPTGYDRFNEMTSGFQPGDLVILAARPSVGKTSFVMNIAESVAVPGRDLQPRAGDRLYSVGVFSLEMSMEQIGLRLLSSEANVANHLIRSGMLSERNWTDLGSAASRLAKSALHVDDTAAMDPMEMRAKAKRLKNERGLDLVIVDYLQLMAVKGRVESRQQEVAMISRSLKGMAKELGVPVIALSQLSRKSEQRTGDRRPQLSDLRESGQIEQDADIVVFIHREELYNKDTEEKGMADIIIAKQRNGPVGDFKLVFRNDITKFFNYEPQPEV
jgi:replicative DNA helicase